MFQVRSGASPTIDNCTIRGSVGTGIYVESGSPTVRNTSIGGLSTGIQVLSGSPTVAGCTVTNCSSSGIWIYSTANGTYRNNALSGNNNGINVEYASNSPVLTGNVYSGNANGDLVVSGTITGSVTWDSQTDTSMRFASLGVAAGGSLTIVPGRTVHVAANGGLSVYGTLLASGSTFTWADGVNRWGGI